MELKNNVDKISERTVIRTLLYTEIILKINLYNHWIYIGSSFQSIYLVNLILEVENRINFYLKRKQMN